MEEFLRQNAAINKFERPNFNDMKFSPFNQMESNAEVLFIGETRCSVSIDFKKIYHSIQFRDLDTANEWLQSNKASIKIIIIDTYINGRSSIDEIEAFRNNNNLGNSNLIFLTDNVSKEEMNNAIKVGAGDYFASNIDWAYLLSRVNFLLKLSELKESEYEEPIEVNEEVQLNWLKRGFDVFASLTGLILLSPILLIVAIGIKLDSKGSIFYTSKRAGKGYKIFDFYKFRTMQENADAAVADMKHLNQYGDDANTDSVFFKIKNDPRTTKLGGFLRKHSLDEIPQLINVLKGDMSLVGNRPLPLYEAEKLTQDQWALRFLAPAGITGLWQVSKRGKAEMSEAERVSLDMEYAENNSFWYDMKIMIKTPSALIQKEAV
jgi:lipopolysaccharide/colanic/teichoic acid biosynthesis glycosyltransferase